MGCYRPLSAFRDPVGGDVSFHERSGDRALRLPCGRCIGCRLEYASSWSIRCMHEASLYDRNAFVTLTYDDDHVPVDYGLHYPHVQAFLKRLRKVRKGDCAGPSGRYPIRFFAAGEYGSQTQRPHYHLLLFNTDFDDKSPIGKSLYQSKVLTELWPFGASSVGKSVTPGAACYVARYSLDKVYGRIDGDRHYVDPFTGSVRRPEFCVMSRKPGLGAWWFERFASDVLPVDYVVTEGRKVRVPRFYNSRYEARDAIGYEEVQQSRQDRVLQVPLSERTPRRLADTEACKRAEVEFFKERFL